MLVKSIQNGKDIQENMRDLWLQNQGFIRLIAIKYQDFAEIDDLVQQSYFGLCKAVEYYDESMGIKFLTYAKAPIKQSILKYIGDNMGAVRIPSWLRAQIRTYKKIVGDALKEQGRKPTDKEICRLMEITDLQLSDIKKSCFLFENIRSLNEEIGKENDTELIEHIPNSHNIEQETIDNIYNQELKDTLQSIIKELPREQQQIIKMHYGDNMTISDIEKNLDMQKDAAERIKTNAIRELRKPHRKARLESFRNEYIKSCAIKAVGVGVFMRTWTSSTENAAIRLLEKAE